MNCRVVLVVAVLFSAACSGYVDRHAATGDSLFARGNFPGAGDQYFRALKFDADNPHVLRQLGLARYYAGDMREAELFLTRAAPLAPHDTLIHLRLGDIYVIDRRTDLALGEARAVLAAAPTSPGARRLMGSAYLRAGDPTRAETVYRELVAMDSGDANSHRLLGIALFRRGDATGAEQEMRRALAIDPHASETAVQLAQLYLARGQRDSALAIVQRTLANGDSSALVLNLLGAVRAARGEGQLAEQAFVRAITRDSTQVQARIALADLMDRRGSRTEASALIDDALALNPYSVPAWMVKGEMRERAGDTLGALQSYARAQQLAPNDSVVLGHIARLRR